LSLIAVFISCGLSTAQDLVPLEIKGGNVRIIDVDRTIIVKDKLTVVSEFPFMVNMKPGGILYSWEVPEGVKWKKRGASLQVDHAPNGMMTIGVEAAYIDFEAKKTEVLTGKITFRVGDEAPKPMPPDPKPKPDPVPVPTVGPIRVMIVYESAMVTTELSNIMSGSKVQDYMDAKGIRDGQTVAFRKYDKDVGPGKDSFPWESAAFARKRDLIPWLIVMRADGAFAFEGPVPSGPPENTVAILKKFGG